MYRELWQPDQYISLRPSTARALTLAALTLYPAGALAAGLSAEDSLANNLGSLVAPIAAVCGLAVIASRTHRLLTVKPAELDEYELNLRYRATSAAYAILSGVLAVGAAYLYLASDSGLWLPSDKQHWRGLFWGIVLYAMLLPTAVLVWTARDHDAADAEDEA